MMDNSMKEIYDKATLLKDIEERKQIIREYQLTGHLDREKAIVKIKELRLTDEDVAKVTTTRLAVSSTPFSQASDNMIVAELQMQVDILTAKVLQRE